MRGFLRRLWQPAALTPGVVRTAACGLALAAQPASAGGSFTQVDLSRTTVTGVFTIIREPLSFGVTHVRYDGGNSTTVSVMYRLPLAEGAPVVRIGPSVGYVDDDDAPARTEVGVKIAADRWRPTSFGSLYLLGEFNTIDRAAFATAQFGLSGPGLQVEISYGQSDTYAETTLAVSRKLGDGPVSLRAGYRFRADEVFVGVSVNTF